MGEEMTIDLKPEQERIVQAEIASGRFRDPEEVLDHALAALQEKERNGEASAPRKNLAQFLMESPLAGAELNLERQQRFAPPKLHGTPIPDYSHFPLKGRHFRNCHPAPRLD